MPTDKELKRAERDAMRFARPASRMSDSNPNVQTAEPKTVADKLNRLGDLLLDESIAQFERAIQDDSIPVQAATLSQARQVLERVGVLDKWKAAIERHDNSASSQMPKRLLELVQS